MKRYNTGRGYKKVSHCAFCPECVHGECRARGWKKIVSPIPDYCPLSEWVDIDAINIPAAIDVLKLLFDSPTAPQKDHDARRALLFLGVKLEVENAGN